MKIVCAISFQLYPWYVGI